MMGYVKRKMKGSFFILGLIVIFLCYGGYMRWKTSSIDDQKYSDDSNISRDLN